MATRKTISFRLTEPEWAELKERCAKVNMTIASFAQLAVLGFAVESPKEFLAAINHLSSANILAFVVKTTPVIAPVATGQVLVIDTANTYLSEIRELLQEGKVQNEQLLKDITKLHEIIVYLEATI